MIREYDKEKMSVCTSNDPREMTFHVFSIYNFHVRA